MFNSEFAAANGNIYTTRSTLEWAQEYVERGFTPIPVKFRTKCPVHARWQNTQTAAAVLPESFGTHPINIGIVLGKSSGELIDVDIDHDDALRFGRHFLPTTGMIFGRKSRRRSHWIYVASPSPAPPHRKYGGLGKNIIEIRGQGNQTVFPGSVHESGEPIEFDRSDAPTTASPNQLEIACQQIAIATIIHEHWTAGRRHDLALSISGLLAKAGWAQSDVLALISAIATEANDSEITDRRNSVRCTFDKIAQGQEHEIEGFNAIRSTLGENVASAVAKVAGRDICPSDEQDASPDKPAVRLSDIATDASAAEIFWQCHKDDYIFCDGPNSWFKRERQTFRPISPVRIQGAALTFTRNVIGDLRGGAQWGQLRAFESRQRINSTVELSRSRFRVDWNDVDADPYLIGCENGSIIDLKRRPTTSGEQGKITKCLGTSTAHDAQCSTWLAFLDRIFERDVELISYIQRAVGYSLTGETSEQCFFVLVGNGSNGKSTFINVLLHIFGDYATTIPMHSLTVQNGRNEQTNDLALLPGKRFVVASESEVGQRLAESRIKLMTGGDRIKCRRLYQEYFEFEPQFKLWLMTNNLPKVSGVEDAIWRRIRVIRFPVTIQAHERDGSLPQKLVEEAPGILNWALEGLKAWQSEGLKPPEQVVNATGEYRQDNDTVGQFIAACCDKDPKAKTLLKELYDRYAFWCDRSGYDALHRVTFGKTLAKKSYQKRSRSTGTEWRGLKLKAELKSNPIPGPTPIKEQTASGKPVDPFDELIEALNGG